MRVLIGTIATAVFVMTAGIANAATYKIGLIASYTGIFATWGTQFQQAVEAFQLTNGTSLKGPNGETIDVKMVYRDSGSQGPDKVKQLASELILREHVNMLTGLELSPYAMALSDLSKQAKVPVVIMNAATARITRMSPYFVRTSMTVPQMNCPLGPWAFKHGYKTAYVITSDYAPGHDAEEYFIKCFTNAGGKIVGKARSPLNNVDFSSYMEKVLQVNPKPDALFMFMPAGTPSINFVKAYVERGVKAKGIQLLGSGETQQIYIHNFTDDIIGTITANHYTENNTNPENIKLKAALKKIDSKAQPDIASVAAWDAMRLIYDALAHLGADAKGLDIVNYMAGKKLDSPRGPIMIDPKERDVVQNIYIRKVEKVNGGLTNVNIDTIPMVHDPWKEEHPAKMN